MTRRARPQALVLNGILLVVVAVSLYPMIVMALGSLKTADQLAINPGGLPQHPTLINYANLARFAGGKVTRSFFNALFVATTHTALAVFISAMAAYAFAKYRFRGRDALFALLVATMMIPGEVNIPPLYILFSRIGWLNTYTVQIVPGIASVFGMFLVRQYMLSVPDSLLEAARIDGAGHWRVFTDVMLPVASPALGALAVLVFIHKWNDYLWPLVMVNDVKKLPIMVVLPTLNVAESAWSIPWELVLAGCVAVTVPLLIAFLLLQDKFVSSVTMGAVKE
jgi:ABC-type glycerol-3-phosphate transport system permease component